jgi:hypothetical protein
MEIEPEVIIMIVISMPRIMLNQDNRNPEALHQVVEEGLQICLLGFSENSRL